MAAHRRLTTRPLPGFVLVLLLASCSRPSPTGRYVSLGHHPGAAAQPGDSTGAVLRKLQPFEGRIYAAYGDQDWGDNEGTGPIELAPFDLASGVFVSEWEVATEAIDTFTVIGENLFVPNADPEGTIDSSNTFDVGLPWQHGVSLPMAHVYDLTTVDGTDLWLVGGYGPSGHSAVALRSTDAGISWEIARAVEPRNPEGYARFYAAGVLRGRLYLQAEERGFGRHPESWVWDGTGWSEGPDLRYFGSSTGHHPRELAGVMLYRGEGDELLAFDGTSVERVARGYVDLFVSGGRATFLDTDGVVRDSLDGRNWDLWGYVPEDASSLAWMDGDLYLGTETGELLRFEPEPTPPQP